MAIDALREPSLPEGLEEAAKAFAKKNTMYFPDITLLRVGQKDAFEAGVKWQASQGHTINAVVNVNGFYQLFIQPDGEFPFEYGDKLVVQIRKR